MSATDLLPVSMLTLAVLHERDARGAVGVVLDALHDAVLALPAAAHVYEPEQPLVAAAPVPRRDPAVLLHRTFAYALRAADMKGLGRRRRHRRR